MCKRPTSTVPVGLVLSGQAVDTSLSEPGLQQLRFSNVFVSNLQRARQVSFPEKTLVLHCSSIIQSFGIAEGRPKEDLKNMANRAGQSLGSEHFISFPFGRGAGATESGTDGPLPGLPDNGMEGVPLHALVVSHGAYIRVAVRHFVEDLQCSLPQGLKMSTVLSACPNTGISRFVLIVSPTESGLALSAVRCVFTNRKDHLTSRNICYITH
uniref:Uncharacterized protein n=1 Tax=Oncorhynchus tshawytscha TaxID=74940 RepID=A0A8C8BY77_ONCTS